MKNICTTHTFEDKVQTIKTARELGFRICSGGIIGMGESEDDRIQMALFCKISKSTLPPPINILSPIAKTPNSMITGDLLATIGGQTASDMQMIKSAGYDMSKNSDWE